jgi:FMN hydrolase / 5-amino-6-(5-phospho-D-ribitylamino)uracil phosphatase
MTIGRRAAWAIAVGHYHRTTMPIQALTLDLDDTLWPVLPTLRRAEAQMQAWLQDHAPATERMHDALAWRALRAQVLRDRPDWAHDLGALRRETLRQAMLAAGDDPGLAAPAFEVFFAARQQVDLFDDVLPALARLAARWPIVALSNGNADVHRVPGLGRYFHAALSAADLGVGKPSPLAFAEACRRAGAEPAATLHIGDDPALDVDGALDAGLQAAWVQRALLPASSPPRGRPHHVVATLADLADRLC